MEKVTNKDLELIEKAKDIIKRNYDTQKFNHTVGAALRCKNGNIYVGVNISAIHGACAETIALGAAIASGEKEFECIVSVRGTEGSEIIPPCGNCRQIISDYMPNCRVIIKEKGETIKVSINELLPLAYIWEN